MKPITFKESNTTFAKDQPQYRPLPAWKGKGGEVISCWKMNWKEKIKVIINGKVWLSTWTFNQPLQPQRLDVDKPTM